MIDGANVFKKNLENWNPRVPLRYADADYYRDVPIEVRNKFAIIKDTKRGLYLHGGVGVGKTHIAYAMHKSKLARSSNFFNTTELLQRIRLDYNRKDESQGIAKEIAERRSIIFLDDIGAEKVTDWVLETFYLIINERYNEMLPTIFTSNCTIKELAEKLSDRIASRIVESCDIIELTGADRRLKK